MVTGTETLLPQCYFVFIALVFNILLSEDTVNSIPIPTTTLRAQHAFLRFLVTCYPEFLGLDMVRECSSCLLPRKRNYPANIMLTSFIASKDTHEDRGGPVTMSDYFGLYRF